MRVSLKTHQNPCENKMPWYGFLKFQFLKKISILLMEKRGKNKISKKNSQNKCKKSGVKKIQRFSKSHFSLFLMVPVFECTHVYYEEEGKKEEPPERERNREEKRKRQRKRTPMGREREKRE